MTTSYYFLSQMRLIARAKDSLIGRLLVGRLLVGRIGRSVDLSTRYLPFLFQSIYLLGQQYCHVICSTVISSVCCSYSLVYTFSLQPQPFIVCSLISHTSPLSMCIPQACVLYIGRLGKLERGVPPYCYCDCICPTTSVAFIEIALVLVQFLVIKMMCLHNIAFAMLLNAFVCHHV